MKILDEINIDGDIVKFYDGIDFDFVHNYKKKELLVIFIDNWTSEYKRYERNSKIDYILDDKKINLKDIENNYIAIYQTNGFLEPVYETIKKKMLEKHGEWCAVAGIKRVNSI